ncbi:MAG: glycosyltransferase [Opitutales bacterium]
MNASSLSVIVKTFDEPDSLRRVLESLLGAPQAPKEVLIADDGSGPATADVIQAARTQGNLPLHHLWQENRGFRPAPILNRAIAQASGDYCVFLDGDCVPAKSFVADHAALAETDCFVQARRAFVKEPAVPSFLRGERGFAALALRGQASGVLKALRTPRPVVRRNTEMYGVLGCNVGVWRKDLLAINGFDEAYEGWGREDSDLALRLYHLGRVRKFVHGRALVYHLNHPPRSRDRLKTNDDLLEASRREKRIRCQRGLDQYLGIPAS